MLPLNLRPSQPRMVSALVTSAFSCFHSLGAWSGIDEGGGGGIFELVQQMASHPISCISPLINLSW